MSVCIADLFNVIAATPNSP